MAHARALSRSGIRWPSRCDRTLHRARRPLPTPSWLSEGGSTIAFSSRHPPGPGPLEARDAEFAAKIHQALGVERANDVDDGQFPRFGVDYYDASQLAVTAVLEIDVHVIAVLGPDADQT